MAAYNVKRYITQAINSVLEQSMADLEVIVADDASPDGTCDVVEGLCAADSRIRLLRNDKNGGPGIARNTALRAATGEWIAVLDADDWYEPNRLEVLLDHARQVDMDMVADNQSFFLEGISARYRLLRRKHRNETEILTADDLLLGDRLGRTGNLGLLKPLVRRQLLLDYHIWYDESNGLGEDLFFLLNCIRYTERLLFVTEPLYNYRMHKGSWSHTLTRENYLGMRKIIERNMDLFDADTAPRTAALMARRVCQVDEFFRYQGLIEPLKNHDPQTFLHRVAADPKALRLLIPGFAVALNRRLSWAYSRMTANRHRRPEHDNGARGEESFTGDLGSHRAESGSRSRNASPRSPAE